MSTQSAMKRRVTASDLRAKKQSGQKISMLTAYDAVFAKLLDSAGIDALLVGDSLGMVVQGHDTTLPVKLEHMVYHCQCVSRSTSHAHLIGDLPFMSYQTSIEDAVRAAGALVQDGGVQSVKLEGAGVMLDRVSAIIQCGIPVIGHIGLTPQSVHNIGGYKVQGKTPDAAKDIMREAKDLENAGCFAIVLEAIPADLAAHITESLSIPTIGIGAGAQCDGQVLVHTDLLGMDPQFRPKFVKRYAELHASIQQAATSFREDVSAGTFPSQEHTFKSATGS